MNIANILYQSREKHGDRPAVSFGRQVHLTYHELAARSLSLAAGLTERFDLRKGDHVALIMKNCPQYIEILFGLWSAGLCAVPVNAKLHPREYAFILDHSQSRLCFCSPDFVGMLTPLVAEIGHLEAVIPAGEAEYENLFTGSRRKSAETVSASDLAWLFYTSGTTGRPKGAMLTHRNLAAMTSAHLSDIDAISEDDCIIHSAPCSHGSGMYILPHVRAGANNVIPKSMGFDVGETIELLSFYRGCSLFFAPTMLHRLIEAPELRGAAVDHLKNLVYGGGPMYLSDLKKALSILGPRLSQIYGQGEAPMTITGMNRAMHHDHADGSSDARLMSVGVPRSGVEVRVFDAEDRELPVGEIGEVVCRGEIVMAGYWRNIEATSETLRNGWLHTGDMGCFDERGFLTLKDRSKDMIISGGSNIYPREVEEVLARHEGVREVSVVGYPHPEWGETVVAFIVPSGEIPVTAGDLDAFCINHIARFKRPKAYRFLDSLPKNNTGKVLKTSLRDMLAEIRGS